MTRRERLEAKLDRRQEWAGKADARSAGAFDKAGKLADSIPFGQPILVGHHSEKHARRDAERIQNGMSKGVEEMKLAEHHRAKADGLAAQLDRSVFSDDHDAIEQLEARIAAEEARRTRMKAINAEIKKGAGWAERLSPPLTRAETAELASNARFAGTVGYPAYALKNLGANIRRQRERIEEITRLQARTAAAEAAGGVTVEAVGQTPEGTTYVRVTFAEKPARDVIEALRSAGFRWGAGSWLGKREALPAGILPAGEATCPDCAALEREHDANCPSHPEYDPTPWCTGCGARTSATCNCGPRAEND